MKNLLTKIFLLFGLAVLIVFDVILFSDGARYNNENKNTCSAQISTIEYYDHSTTDKTDEGYNIYISYSYAGTNFEDVIFEQTTDANKYSVGEIIHIEVFENGELATDTTSGAWIVLVVTILYAGFFIFGFKKSRFRKRGII